MGKSNKQKSSQSSGKSSRKGTTATPVCKCQDPYKCTCGHRPERPSKGHKWDPEEKKWAGKGHKQKGAGTTAISRTPVVTKDGGTKLEQWQKLPTQLLAEFCKKEKRPPFKLHPVNTSGSSTTSSTMYRYRILVMDAKSTKRGTEYDLSFCPALPSDNAEQAKEEAAILALLHLTPKIPHDRKLPQPYKTIFLNAQAQIQQQQLQPTKPQQPIAKSNSKLKIQESQSNPSSIENYNTAKSENDNETKSANLQKNTLFMDRQFASLAEKRRHKQQKQLQIKAKINKREALKEANKPHKVLMSKSLRTSIEQLLRSSSPPSVESDTDISIIHKTDTNQQYLRQEIIDETQKQLLDDGFTFKQTNMAIAAIYKQRQYQSQQHGLESLQDLDATNVYEKSLQWLCIHLDEAHLPERFNPQGGNLDVITVAPSTTSTSSLQNKSVTPEVLNISTIYGASNEEAALLIQHKNELSNSSNNEIPFAFWNTICKAAKTEHLSAELSKDIKQIIPGMDSDMIQMNMEQMNEEFEVLRAIFLDECEIDNEKDSSVISNKEVGQHIQIALPLKENRYTNKPSTSKTAPPLQPPILEIQIRNGYYPSKYPSSVFIKNNWNKESISKGIGSFFHIQLAEFIASLTKGESMVYEIFGFVSDLLEQSHDDIMKSTSLSLPPLLPLLQKNNKNEDNNNNKGSTKSMQQQSSKTQKTSSSISTKIRTFRPRERNSFWSKRPNQILPATPFPKLSTELSNARKKLPAHSARDDFFMVLKESKQYDRVLLLTGETGCGKTTQIPQFILEKYPKDAKIVVAQPRRLAATGVASRVAVERGEETPGSDSVGYVVRGDTAMCDRTRLLFCTTGVLLRQLQSENALDCITHIVVDEVHERHLDTDILLGILKEALPNNPHLHVILMSATLDADRFAAYWGVNTPRIHIPGFTYPIQDFHLDHVLSLTGYIPPKKGKKKSGRSLNQNGSHDNQFANMEHNHDLEELVQRVQENIIDYDMLASLVKRLVNDKKYDDDGSILVFLPGVPEISKAEQCIRRFTRNNPSILLLPLHGGLQAKDQKAVFHKPKLGITKVVLSTNVAETSITIPDVTIVIDTCREKQSSYDTVNRMPLLVERFASRDSLKQRRGRSGRVRTGTCYKLISKKTFDKLDQHGEPEIRRCALDQTLLSLLFLGVERGTGNFLETLLDPPSRESIDAALFSLKKLGAIVEATNKNILLTPLGMHLAGIPAPPSIGKLLVLGSLLGCRSAALAMAAGMTAGRSPFLKVDIFQNHNRKHHNNDRLEGGGDEGPTEEDLKKEKEQMKQERILEERMELLKRVGKSDHAMLAEVYKTWDSLEGGQRAKLNYCESLGLSSNGMRDIKQLFKQLDSSLSAIGFISSEEADLNSNSWRVIRTCVVAALAPSQLVRVHRPITKYNETVDGAVEKDGVAKELKFFVRSEKENHVSASSDETKTTTRMFDGIEEKRVFMHPSSGTFQVGNYSFPWLVYHSLVQTSKSFLRDATECSAYAILLFGGAIEIQAAKELIIIDDWVKVSANARIGALIGGLREKVDLLLTKKVANPKLDVRNVQEMKLIVDLIVSDGLGG